MPRLQAFGVMLSADIGQGFQQAFCIHELLLCLPNIQGLTVDLLRVRTYIKTTICANRTVIVGLQIKAAAKIPAARIAALIDQIAEMQQAVAAAAHQLQTTLPSRVVHDQMVVPATGIFFRAEPGQNAIAMPMWSVDSVVYPCNCDWFITITRNVRNQNLLAYPWNVHAAVASPRIGLGNTYPAGRPLITWTNAIPDKHDSNSIQFIRVNFLAFRTDDDCCFKMHLRLFVVARSSILNRRALRFDFNQKETDRSIVMRHLKCRFDCTARARLCNLPFKAMRIARGTRYWEVIFNPPCNLNCGELPLLRRIIIMSRMSRQCKLTAGIDRSYPSNANEALCTRFPLFHSNLCQMVTALLLKIRVWSSVFVNLQLFRKVSLISDCRHRRTLRIRPRRRLLVVECTGCQRSTLQRPCTGPMGERVDLRPRACSIE